MQTTYYEQRVWPTHQTNINISPNAAQNNATVFLAECVTMMAEGGIPTLIAENVPMWRIPIELNIPQIGVVGTAGHLKIDAQTGKIKPLSKTEIEKIQGLCHAMATYYTSPATV